MKKVILKKNREQSLERFHPWVFSGAIDKIDNGIKRGETVGVFSYAGKYLGAGAFSPASQIRVRIWTFGEEEISQQFFNERVNKAYQARLELINPQETDSFRVINSESDGLPGLIVDKYAGYLSCQFLSAGAEAFKPAIIKALNEVIKPEGIYDRSDVSVRKKEGLKETKGVLSGNEPPDLTEVKENGIKFLVDIKNGHKTGFYLDQRDNRLEEGKYAAGKRVLNCFSYTGGFAMYALAGGAAEVVNADVSDDALNILSKTAELNGFDQAKITNVNADVFELLRNYRDRKELFDLIVLDPPKFAESAGQVNKAARGYKDINMNALKILKPGGILLTFSCSGHISMDLLWKIVAGAAADAGVELSAVKYLYQGKDHPTSIHFPEGLYLKGLVCRKG